MGNFGDFIGTAGGGSLASSAIGGITNVISAERQYKRQKQLMKMQQEYQTAERKDSQNWQERMWSVSNDYNNPINVMSRLRAAGLSPDLFYKGDSSMASASVPGSTAGVAPGVPIPAGEASSIAGANHVANATLTAAQVRNLENDSNKKRSEISLNNSLIEVNGAQVVLMGAQTEWTKQQKLESQALMTQAYANADKLRQEIRKLTEEEQYIKSQRLLSENELAEAKATFKDRSRSIVVNNLFTESQYKLNTAELSTFFEYQEALIDSLNSASFKDQMQGVSFSLSNEETRKLQEAKARLGQKLQSDSKHVYDIMCEMELAMLVQDQAMLQKNVELLKRYGGFKAIMEAIGGTLGAAVGAFIGARTPKMQPKLNTRPIGFH